MPLIDEEALVNLLSDQGPFHQCMAGFESRSEQLSMLRDVARAFNQNDIALIEAGTGTGKSLAYLLPAIAFAIKSNERVLISTHTIHLQEQLLLKDIPFIKKALGIDFKVVLAKGMGNYVCIRKLKEACQELIVCSYQEASELQQMEAWSEKTNDGSRNDLPFYPTPSLWDKVGAESDACARDKCPYYKECHFFKARKEAQEAKLLIVNHSLLFADLAHRKDSANGILPEYSRLILDEAHNIEEIASEHLALKASIQGIIRNLSRLYIEGRGKPTGKLAQLSQKIIAAYPGGMPEAIQSITTRLNIDVNGLRKETMTSLIDAFESFREFAEKYSVKSKEEDELATKLRLLNHHQQYPVWKEAVCTQAENFITVGRRLIVTLKGCLEDLKQLAEPNLVDATASLRLDIDAVLLRFEAVLEFMKQFIGSKIPESKVRWIESAELRSLREVRLVDAELDLAKTLADKLFNPLTTAVLCSATLTTENDFKFVKRRLGLLEDYLPEKKFQSQVYLSPFDFEKQALLLVPDDLPDPIDPRFLEKAAEVLLEAVKVSHGNAFFLFTSFSQMQKCYQLLKAKLEAGKFFPLMQGEHSRTELIRRFKEKPRSILFGTDSFWEGVDVAGDALKLVVLVKLPFRVPGEPIIEARREEILKRGGDPFFEYALPTAIVKFKQGFGRLIRRKNDHGCVLCLDKRIIKKPYGKSFLASLPPVKQIQGKSEEIFIAMKAFYKKAYWKNKG